jgi:hypothetical protein
MESQGMEYYCQQAMGVGFRGEACGGGRENKETICCCDTFRELQGAYSIARIELEYLYCFASLHLRPAAIM